jgi:hypothetical protein
MLEKGEVFNYIFTDMIYVDANDTNPDANRTYRIKVKIVKGSGTFGVRRCRSA